MPGVTTLKISNNRNIDSFRRYKLQVMTETAVPYQQIKVQSYNFYHHAYHEQGDQLLGKFFLYSFIFGKILEEN